LPQNSFEEVFPEQSRAVESTEKSTEKHWMSSLQQGFEKILPEKSRLVGSTTKAIDFLSQHRFEKLFLEYSLVNGQNDGYHTSAQLSRKGSRTNRNSALSQLILPEKSRTVKELFS
jgi:hypothetical protein